MSAISISPWPIGCSRNGRAACSCCAWTIPTAIRLPRELLPVEAEPAQVLLDAGRKRGRRAREVYALNYPGKRPERKAGRDWWPFW